MGRVTFATQRTFDDLGAPLHEVPFCVLDLETTGGSAATCEITEVGAVRYVGGRPDGTFHSLVDPGMEIPPFITVLTGITQAMVVAAPRIETVLPAFLEFIGDAVIVGHNVRFDLSFLNASAERLGYGKLPNRSVDTAALARRLIRPEVRNLKLGTLAAHFRSPVTPTHRALDDAKATAHVLWALLERAGPLGVTHLEDLLQLPTARGSAHYRKIRLADELPRRTGVYLFRDAQGTVFYVGKAKNLRTRVRSYFYGDQRRTVANMLRELDQVEHRVCAGELEAEITELRLIAAHRPRYNRRSRPPKSSHWVALTAERFPRLSMVCRFRDDGRLYLGPFRSRRAAETVVHAIWDAIPIRRCTGPPGGRQATCAFSQLGVALCPCDGSLDPGTYREVTRVLESSVEDEPDLLLRPLAARMVEHSALQRFEEAAWSRDRYRALARTLDRRRAWQALQDAGLLHLTAASGEHVVIGRGRLVAAWTGADPPLAASCGPSDGAAPAVPPSVAVAEEAHLIWRWLVSADIRIEATSGTLALPIRPVPALEDVAPALATATAA